MDGGGMVGSKKKMVGVGRGNLTACIQFKWQQREGVKASHKRLENKVLVLYIYTRFELVQKVHVNPFPSHQVEAKPSGSSKRGQAKCSKDVCEDLCEEVCEKSVSPGPRNSIQLVKVLPASLGIQLSPFTLYNLLRNHPRRNNTTL